MVSVQQVFDMAIHLMDEQNESTGATVTVDTQEYKFRTISILNSVIPALYYYSGNYVKGASPRKLDWENYRNPDFEQSIPLDDTLSLTVLPYYLAAQLLSAENEALSAWLMNQYQDFFQDLKNKVPATFETISTPYGLF
jgi:hypothetical protein